MTPKTARHRAERHHQGVFQPSKGKDSLPARCERWLKTWPVSRVEKARMRAAWEAGADVALEIAGDQVKAIASQLENPPSSLKADYSEYFA